MAFLIGLLTFVMVVNSVLLVLLVLIQLPKKDAGAGLAFGGGATDALFGAGSGTVLTKITKYCATAFFVLALLLAVMWNAFLHRSSSSFLKRINQTSSMPAPMAAPPAASPAPASRPVTNLNTNLLNKPQAETPILPAIPASNVPAASGTNAASPAAPK